MLIKPDIYAGLVREKFEGKMKIGNLATNLGILANTTVGETVTFPKWKLIGDPTEMQKGDSIDTEELQQTSSQATIKQIGKGVRVYDIENITALGNAIDEGATQQGKVFARKLDLDLIEEALTSPLQSTVADATAITSDEINQGLQLFGDEADVEEIEGIVAHSLLVPSFLSMDGFVDAQKTFTADGSGIQRNGLLGYFRGIQVFIADHSKGAVGTYDNISNKCNTFIIKKGALGYMQKRGINIELDRVAKIKASDIFGDYIYAVKLLNDAGVVVLSK
ncbi:hypothetical protein Amet_2849 [Alkaliphilus metalliredigens QYMF]|uniref:Uncharacterized protein n=1 Tax=Alkaliphilus metalliredigens (strain QYMF) TaxID=293826 RepID=A6TS31_ALKMQ|nr:hypothetical protein [Alkaliphilus metalliredigens]ABR48999.1 hypothetical protein Amet_2849 [Alkaliphilus metalliredigens QYMF]